MSKTAVVKARIEPDLKAKGEAVLGELGLSTTDAITLFFHQVVMHRGLPFNVKIPNEETIAALQETNLRAYPDAKTAIDDMWDN